jgi:Ca-activated chloride channel homolog
VTMRARTKGLLWRIGLGLVAAGLIAVGVQILLAPTTATLRVDWFGRPIEFLQPAWFFLAALVPYFFVVRTQSLTDVSVTQQILSNGFRSLLVIGIAAALARPVWTTTDDKIATVVLVDVSDSITDKQLDAARAWIHELEEARREDDRIFLVSFAQRPQVVRPEQGEAIERHADGAGTNIQAAVQLAYGLYPDGYLPRIMILSDGHETGGDLLSEAYRAEQMGVKVFWKPLPEDLVPEIRIASLRLPDEIKVGAPFEVRAEIWSSHEEEVTLTLRQDDFPNPLEPRKQVALHEGTNWVTFKSEAKRAGFTTYVLRILDPQRDTEKANNVSVMTAPVQGRPRVLYVEGGVLRQPTSATYLARALDQENFDVEVRGPSGLPSTAQELQRYDLVMISDVPAHFMGLAQMTALERYVRDLGGGLIMAGGEDSFGSGGYQGTRMEKIMPVRFDTETTREQPNIAIALVIDRSGSMAGPRLEAAKESARATVEVLAPNDLVGVIAFDNSPHTIVRMQRAANRMRISGDIARLQAGGGTNIYPALLEAYQVLQSVNAKVKHVILLSDGEAPYDGIQELCQEMRSARITISAVGIGEAGRQLLQMITDAGDGRLYMIEDIAALPRVFMRETTEAKRSSLVEDRVSVHVAKQVDAIEGTGVASAPPLHGYVSTKPKPTSEVILVSDLGEPLLARWRVGTGTSVAWTSDVKNRWGVDWVRWHNYPKFWAQVIRSSMRRKVYDSYDLFAQVVDGRAEVVVDAVDVDDRFVNSLETTLEIIDPATSTTRRTIPMDQTAAGRYTAEFDMDRYGSYLLKAVHRRDGQVVAESLGSASLPYPPEYMTTGQNPTPLEHAAMVTGGLGDPAPQAVFKPAEAEHIRYTQDLWPWVLLFVACALVLDTYLKRIRVFGYRTVRF